MEKTVIRICADEVSELLQKPDLLVLDVRDAASFEKDRIASAVHADTKTIENLVLQIPKNTPVLIYCYHGRASLVHGKMFVDFGFSEVYSLNGGFDGWTILNKKASRLDPWLSQHGFAAIHSVRDGGNTPLMHACRIGDAAAAAELLVSGADLGARNSDGNQALWFACYSGNLEIIDLLVAAGIDLDNINDNGSTCLMYAASSGKDAVVEKLLQAGADHAITNLDDFSALDMASSLGSLRLLRGAGMLTASRTGTLQ